MLALGLHALALPLDGLSGTNLIQAEVAESALTQLSCDAGAPKFELQYPPKGTMGFDASLCTSLPIEHGTIRVATAPDEASNTAITTFLQASHYTGFAYLDAHANEADEWQWSGTGPPFWTGPRVQDGGIAKSYASWKPGEPNNHRGKDEDCMVTSADGYWQDVRCVFRRLPMICMIECAPPSAPPPTSPPPSMPPPSKMFTTLKEGWACGGPGHGHVGKCSTYSPGSNANSAKAMCAACGSDCMGVYQAGSNWYYCSRSNPKYFRGMWNGYRAYYVIDSTDSGFYCRTGQQYTPTGANAAQCTPSTTTPGDGVAIRSAK